MTRKSTFAPATAARGTLTKLFGTLAIGAAVFGTSAQAATIDFEGLAGGVASGEVYQQNGYNLGFYSNVPGGEGSYVGSFFDGSDKTACIDLACPVNNPSTYYGALNDSYIDLYNADPLVRFQIKGFDASFIGGVASLSGYPAVSGLLRIQAYLADGSYALETYQLAGPGANGFNFGRYTTSAAFGNQLFTEALFFGYFCRADGSCSAFSSDKGQFALDNLQLSEVPEPASMALFGLGLVGLTVAARRRQA